MAIIFALIAFFGWGTGDIFGGVVARKIGGYSSAFWGYVASIVITSLYIPFALGELQHLTPGTLLILLLLMPVGFLPLMTLYEGIKKGNASLTGTIAASFGAVVAILSVIFLGDRINIYQILAIATVIVGIFLASLDFKTVNLKKILTDKGIPYALTSMVLWGIYFTFVKIPSREIGWFWPAYIAWVGFLPLAFVFIKLRKEKLNVPKDKKTIWFIVINTILLSAGTFAYNFATTQGQTSIVGPVSSAYPVLFATLAYFVFKDRLKKQQIVGIAVTLIGIILLSVIPA